RARKLWARAGSVNCASSLASLFFGRGRSDAGFGGHSSRTTGTEPAGLNTIMTRYAIIGAAFFLASILPVLSAEHDAVSASALIREMNLARQNPPGYAALLEDLRAHFNGSYLVLLVQTRIYTCDRLVAMDEAIRFPGSAH